MRFAPEEFFDLNRISRHRVLFDEVMEVWEVLKLLKDYLVERARELPKGIPVGVPVAEGLVIYEEEVVPLKETEVHFEKGGPKVVFRGEVLEGASVIMAGAFFADSKVEVGPSVVVESGAFVAGPTILGAGTEVRHGAYIRGSVLCGKRCVVGHATEVKNAIFLDGAKAGHFAYVGDSVLGMEVNLGAGTKLANLKFTGSTVKFLHEGRVINTGLRKFGAILGDGAQTGCNSVTNPGTLLGKKAFVLPNATAGPGFIPPKTIVRK